MTKGKGGSLRLEGSRKTVSTVIRKGRGLTVTYAVPRRGLQETGEVDERGVFSRAGREVK